MRLNLETIKKQVDEAAKLEEGEQNGEKKADGEEEAADEGEPVGDVGRDPNATKEKEEKTMKVAVGRTLGVGELVEKDESKH